MPPEVPSATALGRLAHRRITDTASASAAEPALWALRAGHHEGDTDLAWTRLTLWRIQVAGIFDTLDVATLRSVTVDGAPDSPSTMLLAAWLTLTLKVPVTIAHSTRTSLLRSSGSTRPDPSGPTDRILRDGPGARRGRTSTRGALPWTS